MTVEQAKQYLDKLDFNVEWNEGEKEAIDALTDKENNPIDPMHLKETLENTQLNVGGVKMTFSTLAQDFPLYVKSNDSWSLMLTEDANNVGTPDWITQLVENPKNNDLAYFIQKVSQFVNYNVARGYGEQSDVVDVVSADAVFGKQTKRALSGLKNWVESTTNASQYITVEKLNTLKDVDNLPVGIIYNNETGGYEAAQGYVRLDPYGNNYAVKKIDPLKDKTHEPESEVDTGPIILRNEKLGQKVMPQLLNTIDSHYSSSYLSNLAKNNAIATYQLTHINGRISFGNANPDIQLTYITHSNDGYHKTQAQTHVLGTINTAYYNKDDWTGFDKQVLDILEKNGSVGFYNDKLSESGIRGATYTLNQLFPNKVDDLSYKSYFALFRDNKVLVDKGPNTVVVKDGDALSIVFRLDNKWGDKNYNKDLKIDLAKVLNDNNTINKEKFDEELKNTITGIIQDNPQEFASL